MMGISFMMVVLILAILAVIEKPETQIETESKYRTYNGIEKILKEFGTAQAEKQDSTYIKNEMTINEEYKLTMTHENFGFKRVEVLRKRGNDWMVVETQIDDRSEFGNTTVNFSGEWAELIDRKLEQSYEQLTYKQEKLQML